MASRPLILLFVASFNIGFSQPQSNSMLAGPSATVGDMPKPVLSPETRGDIYMAQKMYREAIETFRQGPPKDPVLLNKVGIAYHQLTQLDDAKKSYEQALKLKPDYIEAMNNLGTVYYAKKSNRRAISWYHRALRIAPESPRSSSIYMNLGTAYFARKQYDQAAEAYRAAMKLDPEVFERHGSFGVMLEERTVDERARYHVFLARMYAKDGRHDLALQYLRKALEEGFREKKKIQEEPDFASLRDLPEFKELMALEPRVL